MGHVGKLLEGSLGNLQYGGEICYLAIKEVVDSFSLGFRVI